MRVFRPRSGKHLGLLYDAEAIAYDATTVDGLAADSHDDAFNGDGLLLHPIKYDTETLQKLVEAFGPLESFVKYPEQPEGM
ncbi:hypothetical protein BD311DRAFT_746776 [Dichomitus squalens]|uniref:Uncharacterized protein n=1 Tax=Dichomitus squalens TaxID=114155 RepID=A0A4Q9N653_9APHY|nr:hypothetical protein BD311DRAFT_746776 [Dichomitus squalens]